MRRKLFVLAIEGGGIFCSIPAHLLGMLPTNEQNLEGVSVCCGTSGGGMLTCAYCTGKSFAEVDHAFQTRADECFTKRFAAKINPFAIPKYRTDTFDKVMDDMIGDVTAADVNSIYPGLKFIVPAIDVTNDILIPFHNITREHADVKLKDIAAYTSAAPSYFPARDYKGVAAVDAGLCDVAGVLTAVTTIKRLMRIPFCEMRCLLIGTGNDVDPNPLTLERYNSLSLLSLATDVLVPYLTMANRLSTKLFCQSLGFDYFEYFNPLQTDGELDCVKQIPSLVKAIEPYRDEFIEVWHTWLQR